MFRYNELSDLKNGNLVTPIALENNFVKCIDEFHKEVFYKFDDFDFDKKPEDRVINDVPEEEELIDENPEKEELVEVEQEEELIDERIPSKEIEVIIEDELSKIIKPEVIVEKTYTETDLEKLFGIKAKKFDKVNLVIEGK